jgi:hypothetical protein
MIPCHECWPWTKPGYITITQRQNNIQWIDGMAAHPTPKNSKYKNPLEEFSSWFFGFKMASSSLIFFHRAKLSTQSFTYLCWCNWRTFWRKIAAGRSPSLSCSCMTMPQLTGHMRQEETGLPGLPMSWAPTLFSGSGPVGLPPVPCTERAIEISQNIEQWAKKFIDLHVEYVVYIPSLVAVALFLPDQAKDLSFLPRNGLFYWIYPESCNVQ